METQRQCLNNMPTLVLALNLYGIYESTVRTKIENSPCGLWFPPRTTNRAPGKNISADPHLVRPPLKGRHNNNNTNTTPTTNNNNNSNRDNTNKNNYHNNTTTK